MTRTAKPGEAVQKAGRGPVGELALIERIRQRAHTGTTSRELRLGIGDDCAILQPRAGEEIVVTTDFSLEGRHFRRDWHSPESIGHRALARGLSDLAAMGARPVAALLSLALPRSAASDTGWIDRFLDGWLRLADRTRVPLAGGDTSEAPDEHVLIDVVLLGAAPAGLALRRAGARPGDRIFVTGALGGAAAELQHLAAAQTEETGEYDTHAPARSARERDGAAQRSAEKVIAGTASGNENPHLFPEPRLAAGLALLRKGLATAAMDLSDGLSTDLRHLCEASKVTAVLEAKKIPLHPLLSAFSPEAALELALNGGEDYELLFTASGKARVPKQMGGVVVTEIGHIAEHRRGQPLVSFVDAQGATAELPRGGWEHLR